MSARVLTLNDRGEVRLREARASGSDRVTLRAPSALAASYALELPSALPADNAIIAVDELGVITTIPDGTAGQFLQTDGAGGFSWNGGTGTLQAAYDGGESITLAAATPIDLNQANDADILQLLKTGTGAGSLLHGENAGTDPAIEVTQTGAALALDLAQSTNTGIARLVKSATGAGVAFLVQNDGTGRGVDIDQNGAGVALNVDQSAAAGAVAITKGAGAGAALAIADAGSTGSTLTQSGTGVGLTITKSTSAAVALSIVQATNAVGLNVAKNSGTTTGAALAVTSQGTGGGCSIVQTTAASGFALSVASTINADTCDIEKSGTGAGSLLDLDDAGTGNMIDALKTGNGTMLFLNKTATGAGACLSIDNDGTGVAALLRQDGAAIVLDIDQNGDAVGIRIDMVSTTANHCISITHNAAIGTAKDINGTSNRWSVTNGGVAVFNRFGMTSTSVTISGGAITLNQAGLYVVDTEAAAASDDLDQILTTGSDIPVAGTIIFLRAANDARTVVVKDGANLRTAGDFSLNNGEDIIGLIFTGSVWVEFCRSDNGA